MSQKKTKIDDNPNKEIADLLLEMSEYERKVNGNVFKARAYEKAAGVIASHPKKIESGEEVSL